MSSLVITDAPSPVPARLGFLATIPFIAGALGVWVTGHGTGYADAHAAIAQALSGYGAVVVAFIGAIHWGLGFAQRAPKTSTFVWGVVPSLVAWAAVLAPPQVGLVVHAVTLVACWLVDRTTYPAAGVSAWLPLRMRLTLVATSGCLIGAAGV